MRYTVTISVSGDADMLAMVTVEGEDPRVLLNAAAVATDNALSAHPEAQVIEPLPERTPVTMFDIAQRLQRGEPEPT